MESIVDLKLFFDFYTFFTKKVKLIMQLRIDKPCKSKQLPFLFDEKKLMPFARQK